MIKKGTVWVKVKPLKKLEKLREKASHSLNYPSITDGMMELAGKIIKIDYWLDNSWFASGRCNWHKEYCVEVDDVDIQKELIGQFMGDVIKASENGKINLFNLVEVFNNNF